MIGPKPPEGRVPTHRELQPRTLKNAIKRNWRIVVPGALGLFLVLLILTVWKLNWIFPPPPGIVMDDVVEDPQTQLYTVTWRGQSAVDKDDFRQATLAVDYIDWKVPPQQFELSYSDFASGQFRSTAPALKPGKVQITLSLAMKRVDEAKYSLIALLGKQAEARGVLSFADGALKWEVSLTTEEQAGIVDGTISVTGPTACRIQLSPKMVLSLHYPLANNPSCPGFQNPSRIELIVALGSSFPYYFRPNAWIPEQRRRRKSRPSRSPTPIRIFRRPRVRAATTTNRCRQTMQIR